MTKNSPLRKKIAHTQNNSRWAYWSTPAGDPPAGGWPVLIQLAIIPFPQADGKHCGVRMHATFSPFGGPAPLTPAAAPLRLPPRPGGVPPIKASPPASARTSAAASSRWRSTPRARRRPASARE